MISEQHLIQLANWQMPFGRYAGRVLIDLPEEYLFWFERKGWPEGRLGELLQLALAIRIEGQEKMLEPLKNHRGASPS
mgnify:CR=1 FL=1